MSESFETTVRQVAGDFAKQYALPRHIVEEELWHKLKAHLPVAADPFNEVLPRKLNMRVDLYVPGGATVLIENSEGGQKYTERFDSVISEERSGGGLTKRMRINLFLEATD